MNLQNKKTMPKFKSYTQVSPTFVKRVQRYALRTEENNPRALKNLINFQTKIEYADWQTSYRDLNRRSSLDAKIN